MISLDDLKVKPYAIMTGYALIMSFIYNWAYWGYFGINFSQIMSIQEIIKSSLVPFATIFIVTSIVFSLPGILLTKYDPFKIAPTLSTGNPTKKNILLVIIAALIIGSGCFMYVYLVTNKRDDADKVFLVACGLAGLAIGLILVSNLLDKIFPNRGIQLVVSTLIIMIPLLALNVGYQSARKIDDGILYQEVSIGNEQKKFKYLGFAGDYTFLKEINGGEITMRRNTDINTMIFKRVGK